MKFSDYLKESDEAEQNSGSIIKDVVDFAGVGFENIRQTATKENNTTSVYKEKGFPIKAIWVVEDGPMNEEGYSIDDGEKTLSKLIEGFKNNSGKIIKTGSVRNKTNTTIQFDNFSIEIIPFTINSAIDGSGFHRTYLKILTK